MDWIRPAKSEDAKQLLEIYEWYVKNTAITFETEVPSLEEFRGRIKTKTSRRMGFYAAISSYLPTKGEAAMPKGKNQKLKLHYLSRILVQKTDEEHSLT